MLQRCGQASPSPACTHRRKETAKKFSSGRRRIRRKSPPPMRQGRAEGGRDGGRGGIMPTSSFTRRQHRRHRTRKPTTGSCEEKTRWKTTNATRGNSSWRKDSSRCRELRELRTCVSEVQDEGSRSVKYEFYCPARSEAEAEATAEMEVGAEKRVIRIKIHHPVDDSVAIPLCKVLSMYELHYTTYHTE